MLLVMVGRVTPIATRQINLVAAMIAFIMQIALLGADSGYGKKGAVHGGAVFWRREHIATGFLATLTRKPYAFLVWGIGKST